MADLTLGTDAFTVNPLAGEESFVFQPRILPLVAELVALMGISSSGDDAPAPEEPAVPSDDPVEPPPAAAKPSRSLGDILAEAAPIVSRACARMPPEELRTVLRTLLKGATMNGQQLYTEKGNPINVLMRGRVIDMWKLVMFALQVSYPDFFGLLRGLRKKPAAATDSATSATSSPGPSGG